MDLQLCGNNLGLSPLGHGLDRWKNMRAKNRWTHGGFKRLSCAFLISGGVHRVHMNQLQLDEARRLLAGCLLLHKACCAVLWELIAAKLSFIVIFVPVVGCHPVWIL